MKPTMILTITAITAIILLSSFDLTLMPTTPVKIPESMLANALYVCPAQETTWDTLATGMVQLEKILIPIMIFATTMLVTAWCWALYQNLLKDKFARDSYKKPWASTKLLFWAIVAMTMLTRTPNYFRSVSVTGVRGEWVLCENNTPGAKAVHANAVKPH